MRRQLPPIDDPALGAFAVLARRWCELIESRASLDLKALVTRAHDLVPRLYAAALDLPTTDVLFPDDGKEGDEEVALDLQPDPDRLGSPEWSAMFDSLSKLLGKWDRYAEVYDVYGPSDKDNVGGSLADDLSDLYVDIKVGLIKWERGDSGGALWEWRFGVETHWGDHATAALRALRELRFFHVGEGSAGE